MSEYKARRKADTGAELQPMTSKSGTKAGRLRVLNDSWADWFRGGFITKSFCLFGRLLFCMLQKYIRLVDVCQIMTMSNYEMISYNCQQRAKQHTDSGITTVFFLGFSQTICKFKRVHMNEGALRTFWWRKLVYISPIFFTFD